MVAKHSPNFKRYLTTLYCMGPDRVPLGDFTVNQILMDQFMGKPVSTLQDQVDFRVAAGFDFIPGLSGVFELFGDAEGIATNSEIAKNSLGGDRTRHWANKHEGVITDWEQFEKYPWPSPDDFNMSTWKTFDEILPPGMKAVADGLNAGILTAVILLGVQRASNPLPSIIPGHRSEICPLY